MCRRLLPQQCFDTPAGQARQVTSVRSGGATADLRVGVLLRVDPLPDLIVLR